MTCSTKGSRADALRECSEHSFDFEEFCFRLPVLCRVQHAQVSREQQEIFELAGRTHRNVKKLPEFGASTASATFGNICGNRAGCAPNLTSDSEALFRRQLARDAVNPENEFVTPAPNFEFAKVLDDASSGKAQGAMVNLELNTYDLLLRAEEANAD
jgi:hypothetical protein